MVEIGRPEFPGLDEGRLETGCLRTAHVGADVIADHENLPR